MSETIMIKRITSGPLETVRSYSTSPTALQLSERARERAHAAFILGRLPPLFVLEPVITPEYHTLLKATVKQIKDNTAPGYRAWRKEQEVLRLRVSNGKTCLHHIQSTFAARVCRNEHMEIYFCHKVLMVLFKVVYFEV